MREIKFRAWNKVKNEMEQIAYSKLLIQPSGSVCIQQDDNTLADVSHDYEIMQFTGLYDKNKKPIYEGDITASGWQIKFDEGMFVPFYDFGRQERYEDVGTDWWSNCEIIGNVYQNPELLK